MKIKSTIKSTGLFPQTNKLYYYKQLFMLTSNFHIFINMSFILVITTIFVWSLDQSLQTIDFGPNAPAVCFVNKVLVKQPRLFVYMMTVAVFSIQGQS